MGGLFRTITVYLSQKHRFTEKDNQTSEAGKIFMRNYGEKAVNYAKNPSLSGRVLKLN